MAENHSRQDHNDVVDALRTAQVVARSHLAASPTRVWERISTREGINAELMPIVAMTFPTKWISLDPKDVAVGPPLFRSVLLLFGVVPVDLHNFALLSVIPNHGFLERSSSLIHNEWIHERTLVALPGGTEIVDRVRYRCRLPGFALILGPVIRFIFRHRHRRLRRHFGEVKSP
jgi:ligand-binding SRPBCC domain-containing protein